VCPPKPASEISAARFRVRAASSGRPGATVFWAVGSAVERLQDAGRWEGPLPNPPRKWEGAEKVGFERSFLAAQSSPRTATTQPTIAAMVPGPGRWRRRARASVLAQMPVSVRGRNIRLAAIARLLYFLATFGRPQGWSRTTSARCMVLSENRPGAARSGLDRDKRSRILLS